MNVLFVGPYRQADGWGLSCRNWINALVKNENINLTTRPVYYIRQLEHSIDDVIIKHENSIYSKYDVVIQKALPHSLHINTSVKNIGIIDVQTQNWSNSRAILLLNRLDEIYVNTKTEQKWLQQSGINTKITVIPEPFDIEQSNKYKPEHFNLPVKQGTFVLYLSANLDSFSNIETVLTAYHLAFREMDDVSIVLVTQDNNVGSVRKQITELSRNIKKALRINNHYRNEIIVTLNNDINMLDIHNSCSCFVNLSSATNFCKDTLIAANLGKTPIVMKNTGLSELIKQSGFSIKSEKTPVVLPTSPLPVEYDLFTANEFWYKPCLFSLIENMREAYKVHKGNKKLDTIDLKEYSFQTIGNRICN